MDDKCLAIISDTHDLLREEVLKKLNGCDAIFHGGDICSPEILDTLGKIATVYAVRGNADESRGLDLPSVLDTELYGLKICVVHKKKDLPADLAGFDLVITGHTHKYEEKRKGNILFLNPGSCGPRKPGQPVTMAILHIKGSEIIPERIVRLYLTHPGVSADGILEKMGL